jgi:voltage-dependent potassium channel beta subunit
MEYRRLGHYNVKVSELAFGAYLNISNYGDEENAKKLLHTAYDAGVNHFDNADEYGGTHNSELLMGRLIKDIKRTDLIITSKCFWDMGPGPNDRGLSRKHIFESVHTSLKNMQLDYIDIYYAHRYEAAVIGQTEPLLEEVVMAYDDLIRQGKITYWGTSCWTAAQLSRAYGFCERHGYHKPVVEQPEYSMLKRYEVEADLRDNARRLGYGIASWSPLSNGILTGKYNDGIPEGTRLADPKVAWLGYDNALTEENIAKIRKLTEIASDLGGSMAQLAIAWLLRIPEMSSVILGATKVHQIEENLKCVELKPKLTPEVLAKIDEILGNNPRPEIEEAEKPGYEF